MLPIVSLFDLANAVIAALIALRVYAAYVKTKSDATYYFLIFYIGFIGVWILWGLPGIVVYNPQIMAATALIRYPFLYMAMVAMVQVPFVFLEHRELGVVAGILIATTGVIYVLGWLFSFQPSTREIVGPFIYWRSNVAPWARILTGVVSMLVAVFCTSSFAYLGWRERSNQVVYYRSLYLSLGMVALIAAAAFSFVLYTVVGFFIGNLVASALDAIGLLLMLIGIVQDRPLRVTRS